MLSGGLLFALSVVASPSYAALRGTAEPVQNLGRFLERYLGDCEGGDEAAGFDRKGCEARAAAEQQRANEKVLLVELDGVESQLVLAEWEPGRKAYRLHLTPFFGDRNLALTVGKPERASRDGRPVVKNIPIWVASPDGREDLGFRRPLERGMVRLELLVKPRKPWRMKRKNEDADYRGVDVGLLGLRVYPLQGSTVLAEQTY